jgi:hypothetical protein
MIQIHGITSPGDSAHGTPEKDAALAVVSEVAQDIDPVVEKRVLRKIDLYLMPAMLIGQLRNGYHLQDAAYDSLANLEHRLWHGVL